MASQLELVKKLHGESPVPFAVADDDFSVVWANESALGRYPQLSLPGGLALMLSSAQLSAAKKAFAFGKNPGFTIPLAAMNHFAASFTPIDGGFLVSFGFVDPAVSSPMLPQSINYLISAISGRLRAPLSNIFAAVSSVSQTPLIQEDERLYGLVQQINKNSYGMLRFSIDFTAYLRYILGGEDYLPEPIDLNSFLEQLCRTAGMLTESVGIPLGCSLPDAPVIISADENALTHALLHIISNSCRFTRDGNEISITLSADDARAAITITDKGLGIPPDKLSQVCEPFFSYDHFGEPMAGCGLGLSIARQAISRHGGTLAIISAIDGGTTVAVSLPVYKDDSPLTLKSPKPAVDMLRDRFSLMHIILSDCCGTPQP